MSQILVPVSVGELIDKITILEIKSERMADEAKLVNVRRELALLNRTWEASPLSRQDISGYRDRLKEVNETLWEIEDAIRLEEGAGRFGARFVELARSVYIQNDRRARLKRQINEAMGSEIVEEKSYADYTRPA